MYDRGEIMTEEERLQILHFVHTSDIKYMKLPGIRGECKIDISDSRIPIAIWKIKQRLLQREGLKEYRSDPNFMDTLNITLPGGYIHAHKDPNGADMTVHSRFNVFIQLPDNHTTFYNRIPVETKERHYVMCRSGVDLHWSSKNMEKTPRIILSFGFMLPFKKVAELYKFPKRLEHLEIQEKKDIDIRLRVLDAIIKFQLYAIMYLRPSPSIHYSRVWERATYNEMMAETLTELKREMEDGISNDVGNM